MAKLLSIIDMLGPEEEAPSCTYNGTTSLAGLREATGASSNRSNTRA